MVVRRMFCSGQLSADNLLVKIFIAIVLGLTSEFFFFLPRGCADIVKFDSPISPKLSFIWQRKCLIFYLTTASHFVQRICSAILSDIYVVELDI